jgi:hypothetical protein
LEFESVLLPPSWGGGDGAVVEDAFSYSKFTVAIPSSVTSSSSSATFLFGPNYDTHIPNRNVVSIVGVKEGAGMTGGATGPAFDGRGDGLRQGGGEATAVKIAFSLLGKNSLRLEMQCIVYAVK